MDQVTDGTSQGDGSRMLIEVESVGSAPMLPDLDLIKLYCAVVGLCCTNIVLPA